MHRVYKIGSLLCLPFLTILIINHYHRLPGALLTRALFICASLVIAYTLIEYSIDLFRSKKSKPFYKFPKKVLGAVIAIVIIAGSMYPNNTVQFVTAISLIPAIIIITYPK